MTAPERLQDVTLAERLLDLMASDRTGKAHEFQPDLQVVPVAAVRAPELLMFCGSFGSQRTSGNE